MLNYQRVLWVVLVTEISPKWRLANGMGEIQTTGTFQDQQAQGLQEDFHVVLARPKRPRQPRHAPNEIYPIYPDLMAGKSQKPWSFDMGQSSI